MKKNGIISLLGITILLLILLAGCTAMAAEQKLDAIEETIEQQLDAAENAAEVMVLDILTTDPPASPSTEPPAAQPPATEASATKLTADEAKAVALAHAGLSDDQVTWLRAEYEIDDRIPEYEIEFHSGDTEYDYTIHAETGEIRHWDKDYEPVKKTAKSTQTAATEPPATEPPATEAPATKKLTADEAKAVALAHAGFSADQVSGLRAEYDVDDRVPVYEVEFHKDRWEYDYEIHAETGKILSYDNGD